MCLTPIFDQTTMCYICSIYDILHTIIFSESTLYHHLRMENLLGMFPQYYMYSDIFSIRHRRVQ